MADPDLENEYGEDSEGGGGLSGKAKGKPGGKGMKSKLAGRKLAVTQGILAGTFLIALVIWMVFLFKPKAQPIPTQTVMVTEQAGALQIPTPAVVTQQASAQPAEPAGFGVSSDDLEIAAKRSEMRRSNRSSHNQQFTKRMDENDLLLIAIKGELALLSGMFSHYMSTTAKFYELFRIMANDYVAERSQVLDIFEKELLPEYNVTERRRRTLRRRVEHDPAVELYNQLDYIAYHDSIAVYSFREFITEGGADKFATTSELISESKFMIEDFRNQLQVKLQDYDMKLEIPEQTWDRYFGKWPW